MANYPRTEAGYAAAFNAAHTTVMMSQVHTVFIYVGRNGKEYIVSKIKPDAQTEIADNTGIETIRRSDFDEGALFASVAAMEADAPDQTAAI